MNPSERHFDSHTFFISSFSSCKRAWQWKRGVWKGRGGCQLMQVTRVLKFIVSCSQAAKIYTMNTLARQAHSQGASWTSKLAHQLKWKLSPDDSAHKWTRLYGWYVCFVRCPAVSVCVSHSLYPSVCVFVQLCLSVCLGMKIAKPDPAGCVILHTHTHTYISVNGSCQHDSYKDNNTNVTDVCRAGQDMFSWGNLGNYRDVHLLNLDPERMRQRQKFPSIPFMV